MLGFLENTDKMKYMGFYYVGNIILIGYSLKLGDKFMYLASSVSSTESVINMSLAEAWTAIDWLSTV